MEIIRAEKMGFCFGVQEAIKTAEERIEKSNGSKIYILGMLVHNKQVMDDLKKKDIEITVVSFLCVFFCSSFFLSLHL